MACLRFCLRDYQSTKPYRFFSDFNPATGYETRKVRVERDIPLDFGCMAFDALNSLRSALDHAVFAATVVLTGNQDPARTKFPFADTEEWLIESELKRGARDVPDDLHPYLLGLKPHKAGNKLLWGFNKVRNENIHRILSPVAHARSSMGIGGNGYIGEMEIIHKWDREKRELSYLRCRDVGSGIKVDIAIDVAFIETSDLPLQSVVRTLEQCSGMVESIIDGIEAETARIIASRP